jgi:hypothetical protein
MEGNTCAIQAQLKDLILDTLDCLVKEFNIFTIFNKKKSDCYSKILLNFL